MDIQLANILWKYGGHLAAFLCCAWALWRGGPVEKAGAAIIGTGWLLSVILTEHEGRGPGLYVIMIDITAFVLMALLAVISHRIWVYFAAGCLLNAVGTHFAADVFNYGIYSYVTAAAFWSGWGSLICLAAGVMGYQRRRKRTIQTGIAA